MLDTFNSSIRNPSKALLYLKHRLMSFFGGHGFKPFIILSRSRTGSNYLVSLLNSHPSVFCEGELLYQLGRRSIGEVVNSVYSRQASYIKAKGFKLFYYHPVNSLHPAMFELSRRKELYVIHLRRENLLKVMVSHKIAMEGQKWTALHSIKVPILPFTLDPISLENEFEQTIGWELQAKGLFSDHNYHELNYEDLVSNLEVTYRGVLNFLGISYKEPRSNLTQQGRYKLKSVVQNYDELKRHFKNSPWELYFSE